MKENYLERIPQISTAVGWSSDSGIVTIEVVNKGIFNRICQLIFKKPKVSYIHLDEVGSFVWSCIDGEKDIIALGRETGIKFKDKAEPLYQRLAQYFSVLDRYGFITWKNIQR